MTATDRGPRPEDRLDYYVRWRNLSGPYFDWQVEQFRPFLGRRIADVGCGPGTMTSLLTPSRELYLGVDLDPRLLEALQHAYRDVPSIKVFVGDITTEACRDRLLAVRVDTIVCSNLIEHIDDDALALRRMAEALPLGRYLCLLVPAFPALYGTFDAIDGHYRRYTKAMLRHRVRDLPLAIRRLYYFNSIGALGWLVKGKLLKEQHHSEENFHLMNLVTRFLRPVERVFHPPFGISLIAILQRQAA
jgi:SAM-dependent methyltransferase